MDWNTKRFFLPGDTFVKCYVQPSVWQLLELFGDASNLETRGPIWAEEKVDQYFNTPLTVGKLVEMSYDLSGISRQLEEKHVYEPDLHAWTYMMGLAYGAKPEEVNTTSPPLYDAVEPGFLRTAPTSPYTEWNTGKVRGTPAWSAVERAETVTNEDAGGEERDFWVTVERPNCSPSNTNRHVLGFNPQRQEYGGHGHLHTGKFDVEVLGHTKLHNTHLAKPGTVSTKKLIETFGDQSPVWTKGMTTHSHPMRLDLSCLKPWSEDMVMTVVKVDYDFMMMRLKVQKYKYLWDVHVSREDVPGSHVDDITVCALEEPDPSTKYPNGLVMTRFINVPIVKTDECYRVHPEPFEYRGRPQGYFGEQSGYIGWGYCNNATQREGKPRSMETHGAQRLKANECIRKLGSKRPPTHSSK